MPGLRYKMGFRVLPSNSNHHHDHHGHHHHHRNIIIFMLISMKIITTTIIAIIKIPKASLEDAEAMANALLEVKSDH